MDILYFFESWTFIVFLVSLEIYIFPDILEIGKPNLRILLYIPFRSFRPLRLCLPGAIIPLDLFKGIIPVFRIASCKSKFTSPRPYARHGLPFAYCLCDHACNPRAYRLLPAYALSFQHCPSPIDSSGFYPH